MKTADELIAEAVKTQDPKVLYKLVEQAVDLARFEASSKAFAERRMQIMAEQNKRQLAMIDNLEKTLWGKT
jgi:hypothetical protein